MITYYVSLYRIFLKLQNYRDGEQINNCQESGVGGVMAIKGQDDRVFLGGGGDGADLHVGFGGGYMNLYMQ